MPDPQPMTPADVPDELVQAAALALMTAPDLNDTLAVIRVVFAAVLPIHAQQLGAKLGTLTFPCPNHKPPRHDNTCVPCHRYMALLGARRIIDGHDWAAEAVRQHRAKPAFLITTDDTLSEAAAEQLRADVQITPRPAAPAGCARCGDPHHRLDDCPDYDPDDDYIGSYE